MNVIKTIGRRGVAVGLSLALCAAMVSPAFAAQVLNNDAIRWEGEAGSKVGNLKGYEEDGVTRYNYYLDDDLELEGMLCVGKDANGHAINASIDLNGYELALNKNLDMDQEFGGAWEPPKAEKHGSVIIVQDGAKLEVYGNKTGEKDYSRGEGQGSITGGTGVIAWDHRYWDGQGWGGGVCVRFGGEFTMTGGKITGNLTNQHGGGIGVWQGKVIVHDVEISNNRIMYNGGGIGGYHGDVTIDNCLIEGNTANQHGGGVNLANSTVNIIESVFKNNTAAYQVVFSQNNTYYMDDETSICENQYLDGTPMVNQQKHVWTDIPAKTATCTEAGHSAYKLCKSGCKEGYVEFTIDPDNHTSETEIRGAVVPTATTPGYTGDTYCTGCGELLEKGKTIPATGTSGGNGGAAFPVIDTPATVEIEDEAVPLAGLFTRADAIGYLWEQAGRPEAELSTFEDVPADHVWAEAIGWAQDVGIAVADQEGNFRPDDLVLRWVEDHEAEPEGELEEFLNRYAEFAGIELDAGELFVELGGEPTDIVMGEDAQAIFDSFFAKLEEALEELAA